MGSPPHRPAEEEKIPGGGVSTHTVNPPPGADGRRNFLVHWRPFFPGRNTDYGRGGASP